MNKLPLLIAISISLLLTACGQTGKLYLPAEPTKSSTEEKAS